MIVSGNYTTVQVGFEPFWEKPPLFIWLQVLCMKIFGINEYAARLPNALVGTATLLILFNIGSKLKNYRFGLLWAMIYTGSLLPHFYFKFGIIDPLFNLFIFLSLYQTILTVEERVFDKKYALKAGLFSGLAVLTKGPVGLLLLLLTFGVYMAITQFKKFPHIKAFGWFALSFVLVVCSWFTFNILNNGWDLFVQFIQYQVNLFATPMAGHAQPFYYHFVVILFGCFPLSFFAIPALRSKVLATPAPYNFRLWMACLFWVVLILFSIVTTKIVHYSSMCYLPLSFLATAYLYRLDDKRRPINKWLNASVLGMGTLVGVLMIVLPIALNNKEQWLHLITGQYLHAALTLPIVWPWWILGAGVFVTLVTWRNFLLRKDHKIYIATALKAVNTSLVMVTLFWAILPRIEQYTQGPAIEFMQQHASKDTHVATWGFKSYAMYFYSQYRPQADKQTDDAQYLLDNNIEGDIYIISRVGNHALENHPSVEQIGQKGGYVFWMKKKVDGEIETKAEFVSFYDCIGAYKGKGRFIIPDRAEWNNEIERVDTAAIILRGRVIQEKPEKPIKNATIRVDILSSNGKIFTKDYIVKNQQYVIKKAISGKDGHYTIVAPARGRFIMTVTAPGYYPLADTLSGGAYLGRFYKLDIALERN